MAQYEVKRACGHIETVDLYGPDKERHYRLENIEPKKMCKACWEKEVAECREKAKSKAAEFEKEQNLPQLQGTEKQIAWATTIRHNIISAMNAFFEKYFTPEQLKQNEILCKAIEIIRTNTQSSWWIDNRNDATEIDIRVLVKRVGNEYYDSLKK